jgi:hypothetical protein
MMMMPEKVLRTGVTTAIVISRSPVRRPAAERRLFVPVLHPRVCTYIPRTGVVQVLCARDAKGQDGAPAAEWGFIASAIFGWARLGFGSYVGIVYAKAEWNAGTRAKASVSCLLGGCTSIDGYSDGLAPCSSNSDFAAWPGTSHGVEQRPAAMSTNYACATVVSYFLLLAVS